MSDEYDDDAEIRAENDAWAERHPHLRRKGAAAAAPEPTTPTGDPEEDEIRKHNDEWARTHNLRRKGQAGPRGGAA